MPALSWHPEALADVARLYRFLAPLNPAAARRAAATIRKAAKLIAARPGLGTPHAEFREWTEVFGRNAYILRYFVLASDEVLIVRVWHAREARPRK